MDQPRSTPAPDSEAPGFDGPVEPKTRIEIIDILRGWAIFRILLVNINYFGGPAPSATGLDRAVLRFVELFGQGGFVGLLTFLFGLGFALQLERGAQRPGFMAMYGRRLLALFCIGLLHGLLLSSLDILAEYALFGFLLLPFRRLAPRAILRSAVICSLLPLGWGAAQSALSSRVRMNSRERREMRDSTRADARQRGLERLEVSTEGTYGDVVKYRVKLYERVYTSPAWYFNELGQKFSIFLLGLYAGRKRMFQHLPAYRTTVRKALGWSLAVGLTGYWLFRTSQPYTLLRQLFWMTSMALAFFWSACVVLLALSDRWKRWVQPLAAVGRTALTNYLLQSLVCTTLFLGYGFGWYGTVRPAMSFLMALLIFACEILLSVWWIRHFRFGPVEWVWRSLIYKKPQPMRA